MHVHTIAHVHVHAHNITLVIIFIRVLCTHHTWYVRFDSRSGLLGISWAQFKRSDLGLWGQLTLDTLSMLRLVTVETGVGDKKDEIRVNNFTIINFVLRLTGPTHEQTLTLYLLLLQVAFSGVAFFIRYGLVRFFYP